MAKCKIGDHIKVVKGVFCGKTGRITGSSWEHRSWKVALDGDSSQTVLVPYMQTAKSER